MAKALAKAGATICIVDYNYEMALSTANEFTSEGLQASAMYVDVSDQQEVEKMVGNTMDRYGRIDILVNNAGIAQHIKAEDIPLADWKRMLDVNLTGVFICSQTVGRIMIKQKYGNIINMASMSSFIVNRPQAQSAYNVTKAGIAMLTKCLATEWAEHNIRVNAIAPGYMKTLLTKDLMDDVSLGGEWIRETPMHRPGNPEELEGAVLYLASEASSFTTGHILSVDGGYTCW